MSKQQTLTTSADPWEYEDSRGIRIEDSGWDCANCNDGRLMYRPGSKSTCATCFSVVDGRYNTHELSDYALLVPEARRLLAAIGESWHGTPGDLGNRLRAAFDSPAAAVERYNRLPDVSPDYTDESDGGAT